MFDILSIIPGRKRLTGSGWHSFNAVCCSHRGHKPDTRSRGGIKLDGNNFSVHCFNCGFKCRFTLGKALSGPMRSFLSWCGVDAAQIQRLNIESLQQKDLIDYTIVKKKKVKIKFKDHELPSGEMIDETNESHKKYVDYLHSRKINVNSYPFLITPDLPGRQANRIIIPYTYKDAIVGHTSRYLDSKFPKYINDQQPGYVFGIDFQKSSYEFCILVEGIFDALSLNACAVLHNTINEDQITLISQIERPVIFVPDHDETGLAMCKQMLDLGYKVSIPKWESHVKDVNDAVVNYGRVATLLSILQSATNNKIKIELQSRKILKELNGNRL